MTEINLIPANDICKYHEVDFTFIISLKEAGLIDFEEINQGSFIHESELHKLEKMIRLHEELEINVAGIDAITHLLARIENMQEEIRMLRNNHTKI